MEDATNLLYPNTPIAWSRIAHAMNWYASHFNAIEVPWAVSPSAHHATHEKTSKWTCENGILVGSAEQSFIELMLQQQLMEETYYMAATPCFRDDTPGPWHHQWFFKIELFVKSEDPTTAKRLLDYAYQWSKTQTSASYIESTEAGWDLMLHGIEIGSYGHRSITLEEQSYAWSYGTGLAEPRFTKALQYLES